MGHGEPMFESLMSYLLNPLMSIPILSSGAVEGGKIAILLHIGIIALGGWALGRALKLKSPGTILLGLLIAGNGSFNSPLIRGFYQIGLSLAYMPWVFAGLIGLLYRDQPRRWTGVLVVALVLMLFAGTGWFVVPTLMSCGLFALFRAPETRNQSAANHCAAAAGVSRCFRARLVGADHDPAPEQLSGLSPARRFGQFHVGDVRHSERLLHPRKSRAHRYLARLSFRHTGVVRAADRGGALRADSGEITLCPLAHSHSGRDPDPVLLGVGAGKYTAVSPALQQFFPRPIALDGARHGGGIARDRHDRGDLVDEAIQLLARRNLLLKAGAVACALAGAYAAALVLGNWNALFHFVPYQPTGGEYLSLVRLREDYPDAFIPAFNQGNHPERGRPRISHPQQLRQQRRVHARAALRAGICRENAIREAIYAIAYNGNYQNVLQQWGYIPYPGCAAGGK